jgi:topoisomerase IA-like protein
MNYKTIATQASAIREELSSLYDYVGFAEIKNNTPCFVNEIKVCPTCGGLLRACIGKYGEFLGCSNYPECTYTRNYRKAPPWRY